MDRSFSRKRDASSEDTNYPAQGRAKRRAMHPSNKYAEKPPDFSHLALSYPSFAEYVSYGHNKKPRIDWTDFNATRELTRVLLDQDFGIKWWIPDGQLCPTVPNRANYIHWIYDLLSVYPAHWHSEYPSHIRGIDIGTGANCIYPLLGAALHGWHFVGTDITPVAVDWAKKNVQQNPQYADLIEIREATIDSGGEKGTGGFIEENHIDSTDDTYTTSEIGSDEVLQTGAANEVNRRVSGSRDAPVLDSEVANRAVEAGLSLLTPHSCAGQEIDSSEVQEETKAFGATDGTNGCTGSTGPTASSEQRIYVPRDAPILWGVLKKCERFDFCMCNPPFFETIEEAGLNPRTACGGTPHEMVCPGGELRFITRIIEDSVRLGTRIHGRKRFVGWYTSMVGRKVNLKVLTNRLRAVGVTMLRTTEFVQGRTSRWGLAWSFSPAQNAVALPSRVVGRNKVSFMLEGINRQFGAADVLQELSKQLLACGAVNTVNIHSFSLSGRIPTNVDESEGQYDVPTAINQEDKTNDTSRTGGAAFQASVFQQVPGTLLIRASLVKGEGPSGAFAALFDGIELSLKKQFLKTYHQ